MTKAADAMSEDHDASRRVLDFVHGILRQPTAGASLDPLLQGLATALEATAAGLAVIEGDQFFRIPNAGPEEKARWFRDPALVARVQQSRLPVPHPINGGSALVAEFGSREWTRWLLWVEAPAHRTWTEAEAAALHIATSVFQRCVDQGTDDARWLEQLQRHMAQQRLELGAAITRRVAHDYGNVFTGILGFTELCLANPPPNQVVIQSHLREVYQSAQNGANLTHQLRLFANRQPGGGGSSSSLTAVLDQQRARLEAQRDHRGKLNIARLDHLPRLAMEEENLRVVLTALLDNAVEATPAGQPVWVEAQVVTLNRMQCHDYFGQLQAGAHVRVLIRDTGTGMTPHAWRHALVVPFFTTKPRHRGLGLPIAYGVLAVNRGGLLLTRAPERGILAEFLVPVAPSPSLPLVAQASASGLGRVKKILVVDDDRSVLRLVQETLEQAGYAVQTVESAEDALQCYITAPPNSFDLVLSDVMMPQTTGVDLARQLLRRDARVRLLFMSGQVNGEVDTVDLKRRIALVSKPFRSDVLLQAVRRAIDGQPDWDDPS